MGGRVDGWKGGWIVRWMGGWVVGWVDQRLFMVRWVDDQWINR